MTTSDDQKRLSNFYSVLNQTLHSHREATRRLDHFLSTGFNIFEVIRPDEKRLSKIIADLLNPSGSHGQQRKFLDAFLRRVIEENDLLGSLLKQQPCSVICESQTVYIESSQRRIDIRVKFENNAFELGIENKPWAGDQEQQLNDYIDDLRKRSDKFCLVYLTPEGRNPSENSIEASRREDLKNDRKLICVSYSRHIREWIEECCRLCESDKFRWFLRDFMEYIIDNFPTYDVEADDV